MQRMTKNSIYDSMALTYSLAFNELQWQPQLHYLSRTMANILRWHHHHHRKDVHVHEKPKLWKSNRKRWETKKNMQNNIFQEFTSRNIQVAKEMKEPMYSLVAFYIRIFVLNSQHVFRHLPSMLQLMSFGKVVFLCVCWKYKYQCRRERTTEHTHNHIFISRLQPVLNFVAY